MKKTLTAILLITLGLYSGCENKKIEPEEIDLMLLAQERIEANEVVLNSAFMETTKVITLEVLEQKRIESANKGEFIIAMNALTSDIFAREVEKHQIDRTVLDFVFPSGEELHGDAEITLKRQLSNSVTEDPLEAFSATIQFLTQAQSDKGQNAWYVIVDFKDDQGTSTMLPTEESILNFTNLDSLGYKLKDVIVTSIATTQAQLEEERNKFFVDNGIPPIAKALILPAVQALTSGQGSAVENSYLDLLTNIELCCEINGGLNRDIIRRFDAAGALGSLYHLVDANYNDANQDTASLTLFGARYHATMMFIWNKYWDRNN